MRRFAGSLLLIAVLGACRDPVAILPDDVDIQLLNPTAWSGGQILLRSVAFAVFAEMPEVELDDSARPVSRLDDSTVAVVADSGTGIRTLRLRLRGGVRLGEVRLAGLESRVEILPLSGHPVPTEEGSSVMFAATGEGLVRVDVRNGTVQHEPVTHRADCVTSPGPSGHLGVIVANDCTTTVAWQLSPTPAPDTLGSRGETGLHAQLSDSLWLVSGGLGIQVLRRDGSVAADHALLDGPERLNFSPGRNVVVPAWPVSSRSIDTPVLSTITGEMAWPIPIYLLTGTAFSPDGDTLFVSGLGAGDDSRLEARSAATGQLLAERDDVLALEIVAHPTEPVLYALLVDMTLLVLDRRDLSTVAELPPVPGLGCCFSPRLAVDVVTGRLHALVINEWQQRSPNEPAEIWTWSLVPVQQQPTVLAR